MIEITNNFVDEDFEKEVLKLVPPKPKPHNKHFRNQVLRWGKITSYHGIHLGADIPKIFLPFQEPFGFTSVQINEYFPGQKLDWHIDDINTGDCIKIITLVNDGDIDFKKGQEIRSYHMPRFSLTNFYGEMRTQWQHRVIAKKTRYSVVFRNKQ